MYQLGPLQHVADNKPTVLAFSSFYSCIWELQWQARISLLTQRAPPVSLFFQALPQMGQVTSGTKLDVFPSQSGTGLGAR